MINTPNNKYLSLEDKFDFGFTFTDEEEITQPIYSSKDEEIDDLKQRLQALNKIFLPFLENLTKDPEKPMIKWPNRAEVIQKQIVRLKSITNI